MADTFVSYAGDGIVNSWSVPFSYLNQDHIELYIDGVEDTTFTWLTSSSIAATTTPADGAVVLVKRVTPRATLLTEIPNTGTLKGTSINNQTLQALYVAQEGYDALIGVMNVDTDDDKWDGETKVIKNVVDPTNAQDVATKNWAETGMTSQLASATTQANNAATSASNAATSETNASTSAGNASTSASNASTSASNASTSETNAATSEANALTYSNNASTSASNAATSESNASTSASNASTSETNADAAKVAAEAAQVAAEAVFDNFDDKYLGSKAADPTLDNDGDPLTDGTLYYNTTVNALRVYDLGTTTWISFPVSDASLVTFTPVGDIAATDVQAAIAEVDSEKAATSHTHDDRYFTETELTTGGALDGRYYTETEVDTSLSGKADTSHTHAAADVTSGTFADARIAASNVTQHEASLTITESQISDLEKTFALTIEFNGGGAAIAASDQVDAIIPYAGTISSYTVLADQSTTAVIDVWKDTYANFPPTVADSIVASADISLTADDNNTDATLTGWTTSVTAGDILRFNVDSNNNAQRIFIILYIERT